MHDLIDEAIAKFPLRIDDLVSANETQDALMKVVIAARNDSCCSHLFEKSGTNDRRFF